jgi:predicted metal-dependent phosphoesterase TrpH
LAERPVTDGSVGVVHVHSDYSHDGRDPLAQLAKFARERGLGFVCLTDHAEDFGPEAFERYLRECEQQSHDGLRLIPGLEFRFRGFPGLHLLALGLRAWIQPATPEAFIELAPGVSGLTIVAHPMLARYQLPEAVRRGIDAIEVWNAAYDTRYLPDPRAFELLRALQPERPDLLAVAGLDQHDARNDRRTRVVLHDPSADDPVAELRAGRFTNRGLTFGFAARPAWGAVRLNALKGLERGLRGVERVHDRLVRSRRAGRGKSGTR